MKKKCCLQQKLFMKILQKCTKLTSNYTQHKNNTHCTWQKISTTYFGIVNLLFCPFILFDHCCPFISELKTFTVRSERYSVKFKGRSFRSMIWETNCTTWIRHLGEPLDHVHLSILQCLCFCLPLIYWKICKHGRHLYIQDRGELHEYLFLGLYQCHLGLS